MILPFYTVNSRSSVAVDDLSQKHVFAFLSISAECQSKLSSLTGYAPNQGCWLSQDRYGTTTLLEQPPPHRVTAEFVFVQWLLERQCFMKWILFKTLHLIFSIKFYPNLGRKGKVLGWSSREQQDNVFNNFKLTEMCWSMFDPLTGVGGGGKGSHSERNFAELLPTKYF